MYFTTGDLAIFTAMALTLAMRETPIIYLVRGNADFEHRSGLDWSSLHLRDAVLDRERDAVEPLRLASGRRGRTT